MFCFKFDQFIIRVKCFSINFVHLIGKSVFNEDFNWLIEFS